MCDKFIYKYYFITGIVLYFEEFTNSSDIPNLLHYNQVYVTQRVTLYLMKCNGMVQTCSVKACKIFSHKIKNQTVMNGKYLT